jgi:LysM repeat protein
MKLSRKNAARQRAIHKAISSGKALGGVLVGLAAVTAASCRGNPQEVRTMGMYDPQSRVNTVNESKQVYTTPGEESKPAKPNAVRERRGKPTVVGKMRLPPEQREQQQPLPAGQYRVRRGDTLVKIAKAHGKTVEELKRLNGFDDKRAASIKEGEVIMVSGKADGKTTGRF